MELVVNPQELILDHWNTQKAELPKPKMNVDPSISSRMIEPAKMPEKKKYFFDVGKENPVPTTFSCGDSKTLKHAKWKVEDITDMRITNGRIDYFVKWAPDLLGNQLDPTWVPATNCKGIPHLVERAKMRYEQQKYFKKLEAEKQNAQIKLKGHPNRKRALAPRGCKTKAINQQLGMR